ncbi:MAG: oligosaccharide flippase family protein [Clostridiales bacterium]|nr:oligosaccharide flippase family protein [Clostridiales bacterium]
MKRFLFFKNTLILTLTSLLLRTIGMFFRVYISNKIGSEGMGLYQLIISIYILASTFATSGISVAVTRLISEESSRGTKKSYSKILGKAFSISLTLGFLSATALFIGAEWIGEFWLKDVRAVLAIKILSISLPFLSVSSCLYGYFIARRRVSVTSGAQIFEQLIRIAIILICIDRFASLGIVYSCAAVMVGNTLADAAACLYVYIGYRLDLKRLSAEKMPYTPARASITSRLISISAPIAAGSYLTTILRTIENLLVPNCLTQYSASREQALSEFGMLKGMAMPILFFPSSFLSALAILLIPEISEAKALHQTAKLEHTITLSLKISITMSILAGGLFTLYSGELGMLLFHSKEVGFYIRVLGPIMPFIYFESIVDGILKGLNQQVSSLRYNVIDSITRISMILVLVPKLGMEAFLFVMLVSNLLTNFLNTRRLLIVTKIRLDWRNLAIKPILCLVGSICFSVYTIGYMASNGLLSPARHIILGTCVITMMYLILLMLTGCLKKTDLDRWLRNKHI